MRETSENAISDGNRVEALEAFIRRGPLLLGDGMGPLPGAGTAVLGLSLMAGKRTQRRALEYLVIDHRQRSAWRFAELKPHGSTLFLPLTDPRCGGSSGVASFGM